MNYRPLGTTGLQVSEIGFGAGPLGNKAGHWGAVDDATSIAAIRRFLELGGNFIDTAENYGDGHSETVIGRAIRGLPRQDVILATKCGKNAHGRFEMNGILASCESSLKRLGVDIIDVYQLHNPGLDDLRAGECFEALHKLKQDGKIRHIAIAAGSRDEELDLILPHQPEAWQITLNLLERKTQQNFLPASREHRIGIICRLPLNRGFLSGKYTPATTFRDDDLRARWPREKIADTIARVDALKFLVGGPVLNMAQAAQRWILMFPEISTLITGAKTPEQVEQNCAVSGLPPFPAAHMQRVDELYTRWQTP